ncbi:MAG: hypothetical protein ACBR12_10505 [Microcoleus sp.]
MTVDIGNGLSINANLIKSILISLLLFINKVPDAWKPGLANIAGERPQD